MALGLDSLGDSQSGRLNGKVAVVTGAGSGIGRAIAEGFLREGATVGLLDRSPTHFGATVRGADRAFTLVADVAKEDQVARAFRSIADNVGPLDIVVHCAAVQLVGSDSVVDQLDKSVWDRTIDVNLTGTFLVCKYGLNAMLAAGRGGSIINCGSPTALRGSSPDFSAYSSSKGGVHALTRVLAAAYGAAGIRVNTLVPGPTQTPLTAEIFEDEGLRRRLMDRVPLGRLGVPEDYVAFAVLLASDESRFATGAEFVVDGGYSIS